MKTIVLLVLMIVVAAILLLAPHNADAGELDWMVPDAVGVVIPADGGVSATQIETASWRVGEVLERRVWLDLLAPVSDLGAGASIDIVPGGMPCVGIGYRDRLFGFAGVHVSF